MVLGLCLVMLQAACGVAQTTAPNVSCFRSYENDIPNEPLVTVYVSGATNVSCFTIEEDLPSPANPVSISNGGVWVPSLNAIRWGPFFNITSNSVSYRLTGLPATYPINGGSWMDGQWYFSPGISMITVLPAKGGGVPTAPPPVATPTFTPPSGASTPTNVTIACTTPGAVIYYTLDGSLPTANSRLYTGSINIASASALRAVAFTNGWTPSVAALAYYGPPAAGANAQVTRNLDVSDPTAPVITYSVAPGSNATCVAVAEALPLGLGATNISTGGSYIASNHVVVWGPFFGTNALTLSYQAVGQPGTYSLQATWSVDGVSTSEAAGTILAVAPPSGSSQVPTPPPQVATPVCSPASGSDVPVNFTLACPTPGATIYYTLDGSLPTTSSQLYTGAVELASASTVRAVAFTNGWTASAAALAYYGAPAAPANAQVTRSIDTSNPGAPNITFTVIPGANANCVAVTEALPLGLGATGISAGGSYIASNNVVLWGPFFGTNVLTLSYQAIGQPGTYPVQATWSVDGISSRETAETEIVVTSTTGLGLVPTPPLQEPPPTLSAAIASNLPVTVAILAGDTQGQIYYTTDGTLPTPDAMPYRTALTFTNQTTLRAAEYRAGYLPSVAAVGNYVPVLNTNSLTVVRSLAGDSTFLPSITLAATPSPGVSCYSVTETLAPGLTPDGLGTNAIWNPAASTINWGPFLDNSPRTLTYQLIGPSGTYPLAGSGSFNGYPAAVSGPANSTINTGFSGAPNTNFPACATAPLTYEVDINPAPGLITVTTAVGTINWGDGTSSAITRPATIFEKQYAAPGSYTITITANWTGFTSDVMVSGQAAKSDTVLVVNQCDPVIVAEPTNQTVLTGSTVEFGVTATSVFPLSYQWYYDSNPIASPETFANLTLPDVAVPASGQYSVVVKNTYGSVTSSAATLTVVNPLVTSVKLNASGDVILDLATLPGSMNRIWATTNLAPPIVWQVISTNGADLNGRLEYIDTHAAGEPARYYRFSTP